MNILYICDEYPPGKNGGIGTAVQTLSRELVRQGHYVFVAGLYAHSYGQSNYEEDYGVKVWRFRYGLNLHVSDKNSIHKAVNKIPNFIKQYLNGKQAFNRYIEFINSLIEKENINIIEIADWNTFAMRIGFIVKWPKFKVPLVLKSHGSYVYFGDEMKSPINQFLKNIDIELYKRADALSAVSSYTALKNKTLFNINKDIKILHNAIEIPEVAFNQTKDFRTVVFTGTLIEKKGIFQLLKAWNLVNTMYPNAKLEIYGKGETSALLKLLTENSIKTVFFKGHVTRAELFKHLSTATLAIFPSYSETFGLAVIEAMSVGCPVIFTKRSCGPEIVTNKHDGLLIDPDNIKEISESIIQLLENKEQRNLYSKNAIDTVKNRFDIFNNAKHHVEYYTQVINNK